MGIEVSATQALAAKALDYRAIRQDMISSNIANNDTPFYRPRDIRFEDMLAAEKAKVLGLGSPKLQMAQTDDAHMPLLDEQTPLMAKRFFRDGHMARNDGNSVDLDVETTEMSKNSIMFNALIGAMRKNSDIFKSVIDSSAKAS